MAHLLLLEAPGGNDFDLFEAALAQGHEVSFFTADAGHYARNGMFERHLSRARRVVEIKPFGYAALELHALEIHRQQAFDALLCLIDIRIIEAACLAERLGLRFLNARTAKLLRDKFSVRERLASHAIRQPDFALALDNRQLREAVERMGLPVVVKPSDGYGSQNVALLLTDDDLNPLIDPLDSYFPCRVDYGFGVLANNRLLVERYVHGQFIGCDTFSHDRRHVMLGINEKLMFAPPSCAIKGGGFPSDRFDLDAIRAYVFTILDALEFDQGAAHIEILVTPDGPHLVEVNPRLVGAWIPRLLGAALGRSVHRDLIDLHLGRGLPRVATDAVDRYAASRWIVADSAGILARVDLPDTKNGAISHVEILKQPGEAVAPPFHNADRLGYVMAVGATREDAERAAEDYVSRIGIAITDRELAAA